MTVIVKKLGGSVAVVIPKAMARDMDLAEGMPLDISSTSAGIVLRKKGRRSRRPMSEIVAQITPGSYRRHTRELSGDHPVGKEIW